MRADTLSELLASLYDCVLAPERWSETLPLMSAFGESTASSIVVQDREASADARIFEHGADQSFLRLYFENLVLAQRPPMQRRQGFEGVGDIATMTMLAGEREV